MTNDSSTTTTTPTTFAELLDDLFERRRHPSGRRYNLTEVLASLDGEARPQHISQLRNGTIKNPGWKVIESLCIFFDVPPSYFFPRLQGMIHEPLPEKPT